MAYEIYERKTTRTVAPAVTISPTGRFAFNAAITRLFQKHHVEDVLLMFDKEQRRIAVRPITKKDVRSYKVTFSHSKTGSNTSGKSFLEWANLDLSKRRTYPAEWMEEEGLLEIIPPAEVFKDERQRKLLPVEQTRKQAKAV